MQHPRKRYSDLFQTHPASSLTHLLEGWFMDMLEAFGPQGWWPAQTPFEVAIGAILTQNTSWSNVERAIKRLKEADVLDAGRMLALPHEALAELIRPAGYFNVKAKRIRAFLEWLDLYGGKLEALEALDTWQLRDRLLAVKGIGPETADSILLYALNRPVFVVDAYTMRALLRHDVIDQDADYHSVQQLFMDHLPHAPELFNEFHALFVALGKEFCKARRPRCTGCPVEGR